MPRQGNSKFFLLQQFQNFYTEVIRLKQQAQVGVLAVAAAPGSDGGPAVGPTPDGNAVVVWNTLVEYLDRQMVEVTRSGSTMLAEVQRELLYVMAAVADEVFVHLEWEGRQYWLSHLLEVRLFRSHIAGERIFRNIQAVLARHDQAGEELVAVYLVVLALGFRGQYWDSDDSATIDKYRRELLLYLVRSNPRLVDDSKRFFPDAYRYTVQEGVPAQLPIPATWWLVVACVIAGWLVISTVAWLGLTTETRAGITRANEAIKALPAPGQASKQGSAAEIVAPAHKLDNAARSQPGASSDLSYFSDTSQTRALVKREPVEGGPGAGVLEPAATSEAKSHR
jgi:type VI secretion system protein ImpK